MAGVWAMVPVLGVDATADELASGQATLALVAEVRDLRAENERLQAQNTRLATMGNLLLIELEAEADG